MGAKMNNMEYKKKLIEVPTQSEYQSGELSQIFVS